MAPIRVGLVGLSPNSWASASHMPYLTSTPNYNIVAVCNSSVASAQASIKSHNLPSDVKAYGSSTELAADPSVDLVVCTVRVDRHLDVVKPAIEAAKDVFVEWPLGANLEQAEEMAALAKGKGVKTMVGLQGRRGPPIQTIAELVRSGRIGKVLSTSILADAVNGGPVGPEKARVMADKKIGANILTVHFGHCESL